VAGKVRLASELAVVCVLAGGAAVGLTLPAQDEASRPGAGDARAESVAAASTALDDATTEAPAVAVARPSVPATARLAVASSGRSVGSSAWRTAFYRPGAGAVADIPVRALEAYQRAATVIDLADPDCGLDWTLLAAVGKVESDHGRHDGASVGSDGRVRPLVLGPRLTGASHTRRTTDTDAGHLDGDPRVDRALGPLQILPAVWSQVRVDADGDGRRDPHDIDDAALGAAVFLCSGRGDLATSEDRRRAVRRYNSDGGYARLVLRLARGYAQTAPAVALQVRAVADLGPLPILTVPTASPTSSSTDDAVAYHGHASTGGPAPTAGPSAGPTTGPTTGPTAGPTAGPTPGPTGSPTPSGAPSPSGSSSPTADPSTTPTPEPSESPTASPSPTGSPTA